MSTLFAFPSTQVPLLLRDSPVLAIGSFGGRANRRIRIQVSLVATATDVATVTGVVTDGYLPIAEGDTVVFGGIQGDDDLSGETFEIASVVSQDTTTGIVVFTVAVTSTVSGVIAGVAVIQPEPTASGDANFGAYAVQEGCKGVSFDVAGLDNGTLQLVGALNVEGPYTAIGDAVSADGTTIAMLPVGVRFVALDVGSLAASVVSWISSF